MMDMNDNLVHQPMNTSRQEDNDRTKKISGASWRSLFCSSSNRWGSISTIPVAAQYHNHQWYQSPLPKKRTLTIGLREAWAMPASDCMDTHTLLQFETAGFLGACSVMWSDSDMPQKWSSSSDVWYHNSTSSTLYDIDYLLLRTA